MQRRHGIGALAGLASLALAAAAWYFGFDDTQLPVDAIFGGYRDRWFLINAGLTYFGVLVLLLSLFGVTGEGLRRVALVHGSMVFLLALLEIPPMIGLLDWQQVRYRLERLRHGETVAHKPNDFWKEPVYPDMVYFMGAKAERVMFEYRTDSMAFRNSRDKKDPKVLAIGDSVLVGTLVPMEDLVTEQMEKILGVEVMNISRVGISPQAEIELLESTKLSIAGRVVVQFIFEGNDLDDAMSWRAARASKWKIDIDERSASAGWPQTSLVKTLLHTLHRPKQGLAERRTAYFKDREGKETKVYFFYDGERMDKNIDQLPPLVEALAEFEKKVESAGGQYAVAIVPAKISVFHPHVKFPEDSQLADPAKWTSKFRPGLAEGCAKAGIPFVDLAPALAAKLEQGTLPFFPADTHPNSVGHATMAEALAPLVRELMSKIPN